MVVLCCCCSCRNNDNSGSSSICNCSSNSSNIHGQNPLKDSGNALKKLTTQEHESQNVTWRDATDEQKTESHPHLSLKLILPRQQCDLAFLAVHTARKYYQVYDRFDQNRNHTECIFKLSWKLIFCKLNIFLLIFFIWYPLFFTFHLDLLGLHIFLAVQPF